MNAQLRGKHLKTQRVYNTSSRRSKTKNLVWAQIFEYEQKFGNKLRN